MLHILCIVYLLSLANGLALLALDGMFPPSASASRRVAVDEAEVEIVAQPGLLARFSLPLVGAALVLMGVMQRWKGHL
jgi:hypothetical protein